MHLCLSGLGLAGHRAGCSRDDADNWARQKKEAVPFSTASNAQSLTHGVRWVLSGCPHRPGEVHDTSCAMFLSVRRFTPTH
jgi:hypothetical protein